MPNNWVITNAPHLTSLLSSGMPLVCAESITTSTSLVFSFNLTLSILIRFWGFDKLSFFISLTIFSSMFCSLLCQYCRNLSIALNFLQLSLRPPHSVQYVVLSPFVQVQCLFDFTHLVELQHYFHRFLQVSLSSVIAIVTTNFSFESFVLDHKTFALLLETTLFLSKKHAISVYILSHLAGFDSSMSLHKYYLMSTYFFVYQVDDDRAHAS